MLSLNLNSPFLLIFVESVVFLELTSICSRYTFVLAASLMAPVISTFVFSVQDAIRTTSSPSNSIFLIICWNDINNLHLDL